jgi:hypothetical protein
VKENDQKTKSLTIFNDNFSNTFSKKKNDIKNTSLDVVICIFRRTKTLRSTASLFPFKEVGFYNVKINKKLMKPLKKTSILQFTNFIHR